MDNFIQLIKDKEVLLVGNSSSLLTGSWADDIDSHEFVIRFNLAPMHQSGYPNIGKKIDAWFFTMIREDLCKTVYKSAHITPKHCIRHHNKPLSLGEISYFINTEIYRQRFKEMLGIDKWPSSGLCLVHYLIEYCAPKSISLIGFDSFSNPNFYVDSSNAHLCHSLSIEEKYLRDMHKEGKISFLDR